ncbi:MAG: hypothetical protein QW728_06115 [Thermoplasmata archaeon]
MEEYRIISMDEAPCNALPVFVSSNLDETLLKLKELNAGSCGCYFCIITELDNNNCSAHRQCNMDALQSLRESAEQCKFSGASPDSTNTRDYGSGRKDE